MIEAKIFINDTKASVLTFDNMEKFTDFLSRCDNPKYEILQATGLDYLILHGSPEGKNETTPDDDNAYSMLIQPDSKAGIAPDTTPELDGFRLIADFADKQGSRIDSVDVERTPDCIHIKIELL